MDQKRFPELLRLIYGAVDELEKMFPGRRFTPDGHLVGSIGESLASFYYGIKLLPPSSQGHDGMAGNRRVQIKATQGRRIALSSEPEHLLVLLLTRNGKFVEFYNGPGKPVWNLVAHKPLPRNGQYQVPLSKLQRVMKGIPSDARIARVNSGSFSTE